MQADNRTRLKQWLQSGEARLHPLSLTQRELWETSPVPPDDPSNHICSFIEIKGALTQPEIEACILRVVGRQEALRTSFLPGKEQPLQLVRAASTLQLRYDAVDGARFMPERLEELVEECRQERFDLIQGPLYRIHVIRRAPNDHVFAFSIHHAVADGWSLGVFVQDLCTSYVMGLGGFKKTLAAGVMGLRGTLPPVPQTHTEWAAAERAGWTDRELARRGSWWKQKLDGSRKLWPEHRGAHRPLLRSIDSIGAPLTRAVRDLARRESATLFSTLLAAFQIALSKWRGDDDILVGSPVANRSTAAVRETMGCFAGVVPLRGQVDSRADFATHLRGVRQGAVDAFAHAMPFAELAAALGQSRLGGAHSVFDVRFALQNHPTPDVVLPRISTKLRMRSTGTARFDLGCEITETGAELEVVWLRREGVLTAADVAGLHQLFAGVLERACRNPASCVAA